MSLPFGNIRAFVSFALSLMGFWLINWLIGPTFDTFNEVISRFTLAAFFLLFTFLAEYKPVVFKNCVCNLAAVLLGSLSSLLLFAFVNDLTEVPRYLLGSAYMLSFCYLSCYGQLTLLAAQPRFTTFLLALAYLFVHFAQPAILLLPTAGQLILAVILPIATYLVSAPSAKVILQGYTDTTAPAELSVDNPNSFLPFSNRFFAAVFLFGLAYGFAVNGISTVDLFANLASNFIPIVILLIGGALYRNPPDSNTLFYAASLFMVAGLLLSLSQGSTPPLSLIGTGSEIFDIFFYAFAVVQIGLKNPLAALPVLVWGRFASAIGSGCGVILATWASNSAGSLSFATGAVAFVLVVFLIGRPSRFSFEETVNDIQPVSLAESTPEDNPPPAESENDHIRSFARAYHLTEREIDIFKLLVRGRSGRYIQENLFISKNTTKTHIRNIYQKTGVHSKQELIDLFENCESRL